MASEVRATGTKVRESTLPGVGKKYVMQLDSGGHVALVVRPDGERRLFHFLPGEDRPVDMARFSRDEAQQLANLLGNALVAPPDLGKLELALGGLEIEWVELRDGSMAVGRTLEATGLRNRTGASVIAVMRSGSAVPNPGPDFMFRAGDTAVLMGSPEQCEAARSVLAG
ncbi:MAG: TrkA C-terminal domain-containing protein [Trueperaceae bacterium]